MSGRRGYRRIARGEMAPGYWRPFLFFSLAAHVCATLAFSQIPVVPLKETVRHGGNLVFVHLVKSRRAVVPGTVARHAAFAREKARLEDRKDGPGGGAPHLTKPAPPAIYSAARPEAPAPPAAEKKAIIPAPAPPPEAEDGFVPKAAELIDVGQDASEDPPPGQGSIVIIKGVEKEVVQAGTPGAAKAPSARETGKEPLPPPERLAFNYAEGGQGDDGGHEAPFRDFSSEEVVPPQAGRRFADSGPVLAAAGTDKIAPDPEPVVEINSPADGSLHDAWKEKEVLISGSVTAQGVSSVRLYVNGAVMDVAVRDGRFAARSLIESEKNEVYAEADAAGGTIRSGRIRFSAFNLYPKDLAVHVSVKGKGTCRIAYRWSPRPGDGGGAQPPAGEVDIKEGPGGGAFSVRHASPGIYSVGLDCDGPQAGEGGEAGEEAVLEATLYGYDPARRKTRMFGPFRLEGKGSLPGVRVLLPEGVFWEDDAWFSGIIRDGSTVTKYRMPEGIIWKEDE